MASGGEGNDVEAGFAKLQGEDFEYYMQTYSIILGRNSKKSTVDIDLSSLDGGMNISRHPTLNILVQVVTLSHYSVQICR